jgi:hypothetical protein
MAFSATIRGQAYSGPIMRTIYGDWTGNAGDAAGTFVVAGNVVKADFVKYDPLDQTYQGLARVGIVQSGSLSTLTIENQDNVTAGHFVLQVLGN